MGRNRVGQFSNFGPNPCLRAAIVSTEAEIPLYGGVSAVVPELGPNTYGDTWTFDGRLWSHRQELGPGPRWSHRLTYDSSRQQIVLLGGLGTLRPVRKAPRRPTHSAI